VIEATGDGLEVAVVAEHGEVLLFRGRGDQQVHRARRQGTGRIEELELDHRAERDDARGWDIVDIHYGYLRYPY
jgi:hypothetical protein